MLRVYLIVSIIELVILFVVSRSINKITVEKDLNSTKYITYTILLWFGCQALFYILGFLFFKIIPLAYLFGLIGAAVGGLVAYRIASKAPAQFTNYKEVD